MIRALHSYGLDMEENGAAPQATPPEGFRTRSPFYSPKVLRKVLLVMDFISRHVRHKLVANLVRLAFAATMVDYSNYSYEPSLGRKSTVGRPEVEDFPVTAALVEKLSQMADDADWYRETRTQRRRPDGKIYTQSFLESYKLIDRARIDLLITSPPYLNNYHYNRNTRPHLYWLGFCRSPSDLKRLEKQNFGTYWQVAREQAHISLDSSITNQEIHRTIAEIRRQNPEKGIYGGSGWAHYAASYFNDCARFFQGVKWALRPEATALVVIGNSIVQGVPIPTDRFLANIAKAHGLDVVAIHTPRKVRVGNSIINSSVRAGEAGGKNRLYESVVEIRQP